MIEISAAEKEAYAAVLLEDPVRFCREIIPEWFPTKMPWIHRGLLALLTKQNKFLLNFGTETWADGVEVEWTQDELRTLVANFVVELDTETIALFELKEDSQGNIIDVAFRVTDKTIFILPRGFAKTTVIKAYLLICALYKLVNFVLYLSEASDHAENQIGDVANKLEEDPVIHAIWGNLKPERNSGKTWRSDEIQTTTNMHLVARGRGGQVRGLNRNGKRPDFIIFDDIEDEKSVLTEEQREKALKWMRSAVERTRQTVGKTRMAGIATILHPKALVVTLGLDPAWTTVKFGALDKDGDPVWPLAMDNAAIAREKQSYARTGSLDDFYLEVLSEVRKGDNTKFKKAYIKHEVRSLDEFPYRALSLDPALSANVKASHAVFAVVGMDEQGRRHVLDMFGMQGMSPRQLIDKYFELHFRWQCNVHTLETVAFQKALQFLIEEEMFKKGKTFGSNAYFEILPLTWADKTMPHKKRKRIEAIIQPRYAAGYVHHQRIFPELETALLEWPNGQMDYPDALSMAMFVLDKHAGLDYGNDENANPEDNLFTNDNDELDLDEYDSFWSAP